jgi:uncharacterized protein YlaI
VIKEANKKYANVSIEALELFNELCDECQLKKHKLGINRVKTGNGNFLSISMLPYAFNF